MEKKKPVASKITVTRKKSDADLKIHELDARLNKIEKEQRSFDVVLKKAMDLAERVASRMGME